MVGRVDVDGDHPVDRIGIQGQGIPKDKRAGTGDEYVERTAGRDRPEQRVAIGAVGADRLGPRLGGERLRRVL